LITALTKRYSQINPKERKPLDNTYADAMRDVARRFPEDALIAALFAEALMDLHPWNFWDKQGEPRPWTAEILATLECALAIDANNPLANHLYIHAMEASPHAEKAIPSARRLATLVPVSGHLVHMPAHIYIRTGLYRDAIIANQQAVKVDRGYLNHAHAESLYTIAYVPHNHHFIWSAAIKTGQKQLAMKAATDTAGHVKQELLRAPGISGTLQHFTLLPLYTKALFGEWDNVLKEPEPAADLLYPSGIWHYTRGLAWLRKGRANQAQDELKGLEKIIHNPGIDGLTIFDLNPIKPILQIAGSILRGELAANNNNFNIAIVNLQRAVELEDGLNYTEPKDWYLPPRQVLGDILLRTGQASKAEAVYRQDLKYHLQNGWSLFGLARSLEAQGKLAEADNIMRQYKEVWSDADVILTGSKF
jgi:tetratricopeptide (TPR) repeat protein